MLNIVRDLQYAARTLARNPAFAIAPVLALALGIGANTAVFSILNAYMLRPLPYPGSGQLAMALDVRDPARNSNRSPNIEEFLEWRDRAQSVEEAFGARSFAFNLSGKDTPELVRAGQVSDAFFRTLNVRPALGREFLPEEYQAGRDRVVVLSHALWRGRFNERPDILGQSIGLGGNPYTVVGVMPPDFRFPDTVTRLWFPMVTGKDRTDQGIYVVLRLKSGIGLPAASAELGAISCRLENPDAANAAGWSVKMRTLHDVLNHVQESGPSLTIVLLAVTFVLLIACANVANLLLARGAARAKEMAVRLALGAGRFRLIRQMLAESVILAAGGGALGLAFGYVALRALLAAAPDWTLPVADIRIDRAVLAYTAVIAVLSGLIFGFVPAWQYSRGRVNDALKEGGRAATTAVRGRIRRALVVLEVAPAVILLISAGLLIKSVNRIGQVDLGYRSENLLTMDVVLSPANYGELRKRTEFLSWLEERLARIPGVQAAGGAAFLARTPLLVEGRPEPLPGQELYVIQRAATTRYFTSLGVPLQAGRQFSESDGPAAPRVAIVNATMAKRLWPDRDPLGARVRIGGVADIPWMTVVGVVGDERRNALGTTWPEVFVPHAQDTQFAMGFVVRTAGKTGAIAAAIQQAVRERNPDQSVSNIRTMEQALADMVAPQRMTTYMLGVFASVAIALAIIGLYGVISYGVAQRTRELGLRTALGASPRDLVRDVVAQGLKLTFVGTAIGLAGAFGVTRVLSALLFGVSATDPFIFLAAPALMVVVAASASYIPARRAARIDPIVALRCD
ncbi:MAG: ABC transporter permease [Bryobacteraceae bacterium]|nr:ABC transporter permease [Bryobacteraceae bacterium]